MCFISIFIFLTGLCALRKYTYQDVSFLSSEDKCSFYPRKLQYAIDKGNFVNINLVIMLDFCEWLFL